MSPTPPYQIFCYPNNSILNNTGGKCHFQHSQGECDGSSLQIELGWGLYVHSIMINEGPGQTNYSLLNNPVGQSSYAYTINATGSNPSTWNTQSFYYICDDPQIVDTYDPNSGADPPDWHQDCYGAGTTAALNYDKIYVYYKSGRAYDSLWTQNHYNAFKQWLAPFSFTGQDYHTVIGGGGARWLDWVSSCFTGAVNNTGTLNNGANPQWNRDADTAGWEEWGNAGATFGVGDVHLWSHNSSIVDDFYCHVDVGVSTTNTSTGGYIESLGLPPSPKTSDKILILIFNDESACCYHGEQSVTPITVNGTTYPFGVEFDSGCSAGGDKVDDGMTVNWALDYNEATGHLSSHMAGGGVDVVLWPSQYNGSFNMLTHNSYALHISGAIHSTDGTGTFPPNAKNYFADWNTGAATANNATWGNDITTCIPAWNMPPGLVTPSVRRLEDANPYVTHGTGKLDQYNITYPFNFPGTEFNNLSTTISTMTGMFSPNVVPDWPGKFNNVINYQISGAVSTTSPCTNTNCVKVRVVDISTNAPLMGYPISTDLNGISINLPSTLLTTDANGELEFQNVDNATTYMVAGAAMTFPGSCQEYLVEVRAGYCDYTPTTDCSCACTDPAASNYDPSATCDDGSCEYPVPDCDIAYGEYNPAEFLTDSDIKRIEIEAMFADSVYKHFQARRFGMISPCETKLDKIVTEKYLCFWEDKKEKEYTGFKLEREVFKPVSPGTPPEAGTYPSWVDPLSGLIEKGKLTVYFYYDGTSLGVDAVKNTHAATELWIQSLIGQGFDGEHYHTVVSGERWLDWGTAAVTGQFNNAGLNASTTVPCSNPLNPACGPGRPCGGCYAKSDGATGECSCAGDSDFKMSNSIKIQDWFQNGDCVNKFYDSMIPGTVCNTWLNNTGANPDNYVAQGPTITWNGHPPPASTEQVLVVVFADECETPSSNINSQLDFMCYHKRGTTTGVASDWNIASINGAIAPSFMNDYDKYIETYNEFTSRSCNHSLTCFLYPSRPDTIYPPARAFPLHAIAAISSGNQAIQDGTYLAGTAPVNTMPGTSIAAIELPGSNVYWNATNTVTQHAFGYGGLDNYGWGGNFTSAIFTQSDFTSDLNSFFSLDLYDCADNESLVFDVINQNGTAIKDYQIYLDGKDVGKTNEFGRYTHIIPKASINTEHTAQLCECFTTSGDCAQQRLLITATELCPDPVCTIPEPQCSCNAPGNLQVTYIASTGTTNQQISFNWSATSTTATTVLYDLRYRIVGTTTWTTVYNINNTNYLLASYTYNAEYEFQVMAHCDTVDSDWNAIQTFDAPDACPTIKCLLTSCVGATAYNLGYMYTSLGNLSTPVAGGTAGTWGIIYGTNSDLTIGNVTAGGQTTNTMTPGSLPSYPGNGVANTLITESITGLAAATTYYWRAYIDPNPNIPGCSDDVIYSPVCDSFMTNPGTMCQIPDPAFEQALIDVGLKTGPITGEILVSAVNTVTTLDVNTKGISDLTGIECFVALQELNASSNLLTSVNLISNIALTNLNLDLNQLTSLDITNNTLLTILHADRNLISGTVDLSLNTQLTQIFLWDNPLTSLDVSANTQTEILAVDNTEIASLDLTTLTSLIEFRCHDNPIIDFVNITNGNNSNMPASGFLAANTPNLTCISVDNTAYSTTNWTFGAGCIDAGDIYNSPCPTPTFCNIPDPNFRAILEVINPALVGQWVGTTIDVTLINTIVNLPCAGTLITDFTGVECFTALKYLDISNQPCPSIDITQNVNLESFRADASILSTIDVSQNVLLETFVIDGNTGGLSTIDFSTNINIETIILAGIPTLVGTFNTTNNVLLDYLYVSQGTQVTAFDFTTNVLLTSLTIASNPIASGTLDFTNNVILDFLHAKNCGLNTVNLTGLTVLEFVHLEGNNLTAINVSTNVSIVSLFLGLNNLTGTLDVSNLSILNNLNLLNNSNLTAITEPTTNVVTILIISGTGITGHFDTSGYTSLTSFRARVTLITCIDLSVNPSITYLDLAVCNALVTLNLANGNNVNLTDSNIDLTNTNNITCVTVDNIAYANANWTTNIPATVNFQVACVPSTCSAPTCNFPDPEFRSYLTSAHGVSFTGTTALVSDVNTITQITNSWTSGPKITDVTGIECMAALQNVFLDQHNITGIVDFTANANLVNIMMHMNPLLTEVKVTNLANLELYNVQLCDITGAVSFSGCSSLIHITADGNPNITSFNTTGCTTLQVFNLNNCTGVTSIDISTNVALSSLQLSYSGVTTLNLSTNVLLQTLYAEYCQFTSLSLTNNVALKYLTLTFTQLTSLNLSTNILLETLRANFMPLTALDVSTNTALKILQLNYASSPAFTTINLLNNTALIEFSAAYGSWTGFVLTTQTLLNNIAVNNNPNLTSLNIKNGYNSNMPCADFRAAFNPLLTTINVDSTVYATANYTVGCGAIDATMTTWTQV